MKVLFIGGTGNISRACSRLAIEKGIDLFLLNRGFTETTLNKVKVISSDVNNINSMFSSLKSHTWDVVVNWIAYSIDDVKRDIELFKGRTRQYIFISSASAYKKPPVSYLITEDTPLENPFWHYSRNKIECEKLLMEEYRKNNFPVTIVRPSLTYETVIPAAIGSWADFTLIDRMIKGKEIIIHGDGTSLWVITHSGDFAKGFTGLLSNENTIGEAFHITSDEVLTWKQIYGYMAKAVGTELNPVFIPSDYISSFDEGAKGSLLGDKTWSLIFDNSKIKSFVPGFNASIKFEHGIKSTIEWFMEKESRMKIIDDNNKLLDKIIKSYKAGKTV